MPEFESARLKIKRANKHIEDAKSLIDVVRSPKSQTAWIEVDSQFQIIHYRLEKLDDLPIIALVTGDAIHNLRTALDYAWIEILTALIPSAIGNYTKFPIRETVKELEASLNSYSIETLHPRLFKFIRNEIKPYAAGNDMLFFLHSLDILDKHKLLIPHANYGSITGLKLHDEPVEMTSWGGEMEPLTQVRVPLHRKIENTGSISFEIVFEEGPLKFMEVSEMLRIFSATALNDVIAKLERFLDNP